MRVETRQRPEIDLPLKEETRQRLVDLGIPPAIHGGVAWLVRVYRLRSWLETAQRTPAERQRSYMEVQAAANALLEALSFRLDPAQYTDLLEAVTRQYRQVTDDFRALGSVLNDIPQIDLSGADTDAVHLLLSALINAVGGAASQLAEKESTSKKRGPRSPSARRELIFNVAWFLRRNGIELGSVRKGPLAATTRALLDDVGQDPFGLKNDIARFLKNDAEKCLKFSRKSTKQKPAK